MNLKIASITFHLLASINPYSITPLKQITMLNFIKSLFGTTAIHTEDIYVGSKKVATKVNTYINGKLVKSKTITH